MSDIFISYSSKDKVWVRKLAVTLEQYGLNVWWDPEIKAGQHYRKVIQEALDRSKCAVVVWSNNSVKSRWVQAEATQSIDRDILIPISHGNVRIPMPFNTIQTAALDGWNGDISDKRFQNLISGIALHCPNMKLQNQVVKDQAKKVAALEKQQQAKDKLKEQQQAKQKAKELVILREEEQAKQKATSTDKSIVLNKNYKNEPNQNNLSNRIKFYLLQLFNDDFDDETLESDFRKWRKKHHHDNKCMWNYYDGMYRSQFLAERSNSKK